MYQVRANLSRTCAGTNGDGQALLACMLGNQYVAVPVLDGSVYQVLKGAGIGQRASGELADRVFTMRQRRTIRWEKLPKVWE